MAHGDDGQIATVRYSMLTPMLLNDLQQHEIENLRAASELNQFRTNSYNSKQIANDALVNCVGS